MRGLASTINSAEYSLNNIAFTRRVTSRLFAAGLKPLASPSGCCDAFAQCVRDSRGLRFPPNTSQRNTSIPYLAFLGRLTNESPSSKKAFFIRAFSLSSSPKHRALTRVCLRTALFLISAIAFCLESLRP